MIIRKNNYCLLIKDKELSGKEIMIEAREKKKKVWKDIIDIYKYTFTHIITLSFKLVGL